jgi:hypothetical protein
VKKKKGKPQTQRTPSLLYALFPIELPSLADLLARFSDGILRPFDPVRSTPSVRPCPAPRLKQREVFPTDAQAAIQRMASEAPGPGKMYALQARRHIATLRSARPDIIINIRWYTAHKGVAGNGKADEWAKLAAEEPDAGGVEWLEGGARPMPLPRSLAHLKREISEKKWTEVRRWAGERVTTKKYRLLREQRPDKVVSGSSKRLASRFYQLKTRNCVTGQYLGWTKNQPTAKCWWCLYRTQTRDHLFKNCPRWKP